MKKSLKASEQRRPEIAKARDLWIKRRRRFFNKALARLIFIDETSTNTRLTKRTGWSRRGQRFVAYAPFGKWKTQTFIAGLRSHGMVAPWIVNAPMNSRIFEVWIETQLAPTLSPGDVVILD
ncbi:transposase, partial [Neorhizobium galegae]|uniref:transposase n=1 Tax=Neorhizobium galegae TaxID=399 RepID=UPI00351D4B6D